MSILYVRSAGFFKAGVTRDHYKALHVSDVNCKTGLVQEYGMVFKCNDVINGWLLWRMS